MARPKKINEAEKPVWLKYTDKEVIAIIEKLANKGLTAEKIGLVLKDQYGIPSVKLYNLKIRKVLQDLNKYEEPTNKNLKAKLDNIVEHYKKNKQDRTAERSLIITKAKLKKEKNTWKQKTDNPVKRG